MHAARILGNIAAQRAGDLRGRVGRVVEAVRRRGFRHRQVAHTGLDDGQPGQRIDAQNPFEAGQRQHDALGMRHGTAGQAGTGTAGNDRRAQLVAGAQHVDDLPLGFRQADGER